MEIKFKLISVGAEAPSEVAFSSGWGNYKFYFGFIGYRGNGVFSINVRKNYAKDVFESTLSELIGLNPEMEIKGIMGPLECQEYDKFVVVFGQK